MASITDTDSADHVERDRDYATVEGTEGVPITLDDEQDHTGDLPPEGINYWEEYASGLVGESADGEHDVFLWNAAYIVRGPREGKSIWIGRDFREHDTAFAVVPKERRSSGMRDNNFVRRGWHFAEHLDPEALRVTRTDDSVEWAIQDSRYTSRPPEYSLRGRHAGVDLDLVHRECAPVLWQWGAWSDPSWSEQLNRAGYDVLTRVDGTIAAGGRKFEIAGGAGFHEHITVGELGDVMKNYPYPNALYWGYSLTEEIGIWFMRPSQIDLGWLYVDGRQIKYTPAQGQGSIAFTTLEHWDDPRNGLHAPCRWHVSMSGTEGTLDVEWSAHARVYHLWTVAEGHKLSYWNLCSLNGAFYHPDGRRTDIVDAPMMFSWNRHFLVRQETLDGQVLG
jgi:hypothetical protein